MHYTVEQKINGFDAWLGAEIDRQLGENIVVTRALEAGLHRSNPLMCAKVVGLGHWLKVNMEKKFAIEGEPQ